MTNWFIEHKWISFILIYVFLSFVYYNVFRTRKLPILKSAIVYLALAFGAFILLLFQVDFKLPIIQALLIAIALMLIVRVRYFIENRNK